MKREWSAYKLEVLERREWGSYCLNNYNYAEHLYMRSIYICGEFIYKQAEIIVISSHISILYTFSCVI